MFHFILFCECFRQFSSSEKQKHWNYLMKCTTAIPKDMLINGFTYRYYVEAEKKGYECSPQYRRLHVAKDVLNKTGNSWSCWNVLLSWTFVKYCDRKMNYKLKAYSSVWFHVLLICTLLYIECLKYNLSKQENICKCCIKLCYFCWKISHIFILFI